VTAEALKIHHIIGWISCCRGWFRPIHVLFEVAHSWIVRKTY